MFITTHFVRAPPLQLLRYMQTDIWHVRTCCSSYSSRGLTHSHPLVISTKQPKIIIMTKIASYETADADACGTYFCFPRQALFRNLELTTGFGCWTSNFLFSSTSWKWLIRFWREWAQMKEKEMLHVAYLSFRKNPFFETWNSTLINPNTLNTTLIQP